MNELRLDVASGPMPKVLMLTTEPLPVAGLPATGAGLRAWSLAEALRNAGIEVRLLMADDATATYAPATDGVPGAARLPEWVGTFERTESGVGLRDAVRREAPDAIVLQHWGLAAELGEVEVPLAIDLAGPHLIERRLWGSVDPEGDLLAKLDALRRADFLTASGRYQRHYFLPYLAQAGWDIADPNVLPVIRFGWPAAPQPAPTRGGESLRLIYGGYFLPWQDPRAAIETALDALDAAGRGEIWIIGGAHPRQDVSRGRFEALIERARAHPRVRLLPPMPFDRYWALLREGGVALDLMARNAERELAFTTRTVIYLAAGLPVIHDDYSELGAMIRDAGAGWVLDPSDRVGLRDLLDALLSGRLDPAPAARAARHLAAEALDPRRLIEPLAAFCRAPRVRAGKAAVRVAWEERERALRRASEELERTRAELARLQGKRWVRWGLAATSARGWLRIPMAAWAAIVGVLLVPVFFVNDWTARRGRSPRT